MMKKLWKGLRHNHKGLSLVELICTVAIFSIATTAIGGAMIVGSRNYQRGNTELELQQQAQIAANLLSNLIIDADEAEILDDGRLHVKKGSDEFYVFYDSGEIKYSDQADGAGAQVLAERVTDFTAQTDTNKNVNISLEFASQDGRTFANNFNITPRNASSMAGSDEETGNRVRLYVENEITLEPNQEYDLSVRIVGTNEGRYTVSPVSGSAPGSGTTVSNGTMNSTTDEIHIKVGSNETNESFSFTVTSVENATVSQLVTVHVRRVKQLRLSGVLISGRNGKEGAQYKVTADIAGDNLPKVLGSWYDVDYVDPYVMEWTKDAGEGSLYSAQLFDDPLNPYMIITLNRNMVSGETINIKATAMHPEGESSGGTKTNKRSVKDNSRVPYGESVFHTWTLRAPGWRRNGILDIGVHEKIDDRDFWIDEDGKPHHKYQAEVSYTAYNEYNMVVASASMNPWTESTNNYLNAIIDENDIKENWGLQMNPSTDAANWSWVSEAEKQVNWYKSYSTPYFSITPIIDQYYSSTGGGYDWSNNNPAGLTWAPMRYAYGGGKFIDPVRYEISVSYQYTDESGNLSTNVITDEYEVEDVSIQYKNAVSSNWSRINKIYVTTSDTITDYKVYFMFDAGWEGTQYYFSDLTRFVGVINDDQYDDIKDERRDIAVTQDAVLSTSSHPGTVESTYLTFHLSAADKEECKNLSAAYGGVVKEVYEYNPFLDMLNKNETQGPLIQDWYIDENGWHPAVYEIIYEVVYPSYGEYGTITHDRMQDMTGCEGVVEFHFVDPNITGATLKTMYCPTLAEYGPQYYIDDTSRFSIQATTAQYQELVGDTWSTVVNLTWNGSGWIAN